MDLRLTIIICCYVGSVCGRSKILTWILTRDSARRTLTHGQITLLDVEGEGSYCTEFHGCVVGCCTV